MADGYVYTSTLQLSDCTKPELIQICKSLSASCDRDGFHLAQALIDIAQQRASRAMDRAADATGRVLEALRRYDELIAPYEGMRWTDVPADIRCRAVALLTEAQSAEVERRKRSVGMPRKPERGRGDGAR